MEAIKQELVEAGVIGRVVDDFNPHIQLILFYGDKRISLGEELSLADADTNQILFNTVSIQIVPS
jgi:hypothetical protein